MAYIESLRVRVQPRSNEQFVALVDGIEIGTFKTKQEAEEKARDEASRIEGF